MPLENLRTDLKSLKYGKDRPDGGDSGQPFIKKDINTANPTSAGFTAANKDFLLRGGTAAPVKAVTDALRLTKYFFNLKSPSGLLFVAKQNLLSQTGVETQATLNPNEGVYTPLSTLTQAIGGFAGLQTYKQGLNPLEGVTTYTDVFDKVKGGPNGYTNRLVELWNTKIYDLPITTTSPRNKISSLEGDLLSYGGGPGSILGIGTTNIPVYSERTGLNNISLQNIGFSEEITGSRTIEDNVTGLPISVPSTPFNVFQYKNSSFNIDKVYRNNNSTISKVYEQFIPNKTSIEAVETLGVLTSTAQINPLPEGNSVVINTSVYRIPNSLSSGTRIKDNFTVVSTTQQLDLAAFKSKGNKTNPGSFQQDFRTIGLQNEPNFKLISGIAPSYNPSDKKTYEGTVGSRVGMTSPGLRGDRKNYQKGKIVNGIKTVVDEINFQPIYESKTGVRQDSTIKKNDLVKFRIAALNKENPNLKQFIHFRAFINSFSDSYSAEWSGQKFMGRGEQFYKYGGFGRDVSLSFTVAAQSKPELMAQYKKLNFLASNLAPTYSTKGYMGGPLIQLTLGGWCYELPGFISSLGLGVPQESPWEIGINISGSSDSTVKEMPHIVNVDMKFTPIHTFRPEKQKLTFGGDGDEVDSYGPQRYIQLTNGINNNYVPVSLADAQSVPGEGVESIEEFQYNKKRFDDKGKLIGYDTYNEF